jgi:creatinine amidohydrolase/Fe(II)-dependent formamide hydrolase-like protein
VQVCILIDPSQTLAEANANDSSSSSSDGSKSAAAQRAATSSNGGAAPEPTTASDLDTNKLVQVTVSHTVRESRSVQLWL